MPAPSWCAPRSTRWLPWSRSTRTAPWSHGPSTPDRADWDSATFDPDLAVRIQAAAREAGVEVTFRSLAGDVGAALGRLAEVVGAEMIVVGSREGGVRASMHDFFSGSLAAHLSHHQSRPVVVVPIGPTATGGAAPRKDRGR